MKLVHMVLVTMLAFAAGWIGYMMGEQRLELADLRDSQTALLEGLSRQVDDVAQRFEGRPAMARERSAAADASTGDSEHEMAKALYTLQDTLAAMSRKQSGMAGLDAAPAAPRDDAALAAWSAKIRQDPSAWRASFGWSYARTLATLGAPDGVSQDNGCVCWSYSPASGDGFTLSFVDGGLVGASASER